MPAPTSSSMPPLGRAALALALTLVTLGAQAQWTWRDRNGQLHASDRPPPSEVPERDIVRRPHQQRVPTAPRPVAAASAPDAAAAGSAREVAAKGDPELEARLKRANEEKLAQADRDKARQAALRADNCQRAQEALRTYESGVRLTRVNERGEREFIDDGARAEQVARAQQVVQTDCR